MIAIELADVAATDALGRRLGALLFPGAVIALDGPLGAGKTHLTRAIVEGLNGDPLQVSSPTFTLIHEYAARLPVFHFDAYRLKTEAEFRDLGIDEYFAAGGVCIIEWAEKFPECLPRERLAIRIDRPNEDRRIATLDAIGDKYLSMLIEPARFAFGN